MPNPDANYNSVYAGLVGGLVMGFICVAIFMNFNNDYDSAKWSLFIALPLSAAIISVIINFSSQKIVCDKIDAGKAFTGVYPPIIAILIGLLIPYFNRCRIPIASLFGPFYETKNSNSKSNKTDLASCCPAPILLELIEKQKPYVKAASYSFYVFISMIFGVVIGNSMSTTC